MKMIPFGKCSAFLRHLTREKLSVVCISFNKRIENEKNSQLTVEKKNERKEKKKDGLKAL